jgi:aminodeoxyfutalosine synthase
MSRVLESLAQAAGLGPIHDKVLAGDRLTFDDGLALFKSRALMAAGALANVVRERKNGNAAYFVRNMHLNPTNVCTVDCKFCGFYRPYKNKEQGWTWDLERALGEVKANLSDAITEVHIVGGHNPDYRTSSTWTSCAGSTR